MRALRSRTVASHELNRDSSRSHALFTIYVDVMVQEEGGHIMTRHGKITFVDLAGSERLKASKSEGTTLKETGAINKSIFTLGKVRNIPTVNPGWSSSWETGAMSTLR
jgi:hypothetical protein